MAYGTSRIATRRVGSYPYRSGTYPNSYGTTPCGPCGVPAVAYQSTARDHVERYLYKADGSVHEVPEHVALYGPATTGLVQGAGPRIPLYNAPVTRLTTDGYADGYVVRTASPFPAAHSGFVRTAQVVAPTSTTFVSDTTLPYSTYGAPVQRVVQRDPLYVDPITQVIGDVGLPSRIYPEDVLVRDGAPIASTLLSSGLVPSTIGPVGIYSHPNPILARRAIPYTPTASLPVDYAAYELGLTPPRQYGAVRRFTDYADFTKYSPKPYYDGAYDYFADYTVGSLGAAGPAAGIAATTYTPGGPNPVLPARSRYGRVYRAGGYVGGPLPGYVHGPNVALGNYGHTVGSAPTYVTAAPRVNLAAPTYRFQSGLLTGAPTYTGLTGAVGPAPTYVPGYNDFVIEEGYGAPVVNLAPRYVAPPEVTYY